MPGAQVVAVNVGTKDTYEATTNAEGYYNIQFVRTGNYDITVTVAGFQTFKATGVEVANNQVVRTNAVMKVGGLTESVNVEAAAPGPDHRQRGRIRDDRQARDRRPAARAAATSGVWRAPPPACSAASNSDIGLSFRGAGQREIQNSLSLDGINSSSNLLAATSMRPIADAVEEIQVQTGSTSAEYGSYLGVAHQRRHQERHQRAARLHLQLLPGRCARIRADISRTRRCRRTRGGATSSASRSTGRWCIPKLYDGHNKTFFMGAYEGVRAESLSPATASVPTALMRQGNFSEISTAIKNPLTGQTFHGQHHPAVACSRRSR